MNNLFTIDVRIARRVAYTMMAALLLVAGFPALHPPKASADQFSQRSIQLSDSAASGTSITSGVGSGVAVTYQVTFTNVNQASSMVIDFCTEDPIVNDTCTAPTGMTAATGMSNVSGTVGGTGWVLTAAAGQAKLARTGGSGANDAQPAATQIFTLTGITNPSTVGTFYARMYSYTNDTWGTYASATSVGNFVDYGGIALSTTNTITITGRVQEQLTFCVTSADQSTWTTHDCSDTQVGSNLPALTLGHGSPTKVLDSNTVDTGTIYSQISTNATHGAVINLRNSNTTCGGLSADNGTTCAIPPINSGSNAGASAMVAGTAAFGLFVSDSAQDVNGVGSTTPSSIYHNASHVTIPTDLWYGMDNTTASGAGTVPSTYTGAITSLYGSTIASTTAPTYRVNNSYTFAATSALTTPAGIYTANLSMIATGTF